MPFKAFADDVSQTMVDELTVENQGNRVSIYGSMQITLDQIGLTHARQLQDILRDAISYLEQQTELPDQLAAPEAAEEVDNPFWQNPSP